MLDDSAPLPEKENPVKLEALKDKISVNKVSFKYQDEEKQVLKDVSIEISKGQMIALVGESGGGKSSLIKCFRGFTIRRRVRFYGTEQIARCRNFKPEKQLALVTQETVLFNDSVRYNISYGKPDATEEEIKEAAKIAFADSFIEELPDKYETIVGERGTFFSGGQRTYACGFLSPQYAEY